MRRLAAALAAASALAAAGGAASAEPVAPPRPVVLDRIVAVVNDEVITLAEIDSQIPPGRPLSPDDHARARREILDRLIEAALVAQEAARANVTASEAEIAAEVAAVREREKLSEEELGRALAAEGLTLEEYRARVADNIRRAKVISRTVRGALTIPNERLRAYYEANRAQFTPPASVRVRLLLLPLDADASEAEQAAARAQAQALRARAAGGEPFEALVRAHSRGPAAAEGGDLGTMRAGQLDPRFEAALRGLKPGQLSAPIVLESGIALLQLVERTGGEPQPFEAVRDQIYRTLYDQEFEKALTQWVRELRAKAAIEVRL
jgi:peptidyl-prolyl cis-trans isomerase SurA